MKNFQFSWRITLVCVVLAAIMIRCSLWQWDRYTRKLALVASYETHSVTDPILLSPTMLEAGDLGAFFNKKVQITGRYDFDHEVIVTNKKAASGPGHHLLTPFIIDGTDKAIFVSRGFIPFADRNPDSWTKYRSAESETVQGVLKPNILPWKVGPKNPKVGDGAPFATVWYYEEVSKMSQQLPYPSYGSAYIQRIGGGPNGGFPTQAISIEVPPSTHFGYTIEWALLALATLLIGFLLQAFPHYRGLRSRRTGSNDEAVSTDQNQ